MRTVTFHLGPNAEQVKAIAQRHIGKKVRQQLAKEVMHEAG